MSAEHYKLVERVQRLEALIARRFGGHFCPHDDGEWHAELARGCVRCSAFADPTQLTIEEIRDDSDSSPR